MKSQETLTETLKLFLPSNMFFKGPELDMESAMKAVLEETVPYRLAITFTTTTALFNNWLRFPTLLREATKCTS